MNKDNLYTQITFNRTYLFEVCRVGFIAKRIGDLTCDGFVLTERLHQLDVPYQVCEWLVNSGVAQDHA